MRVPNENRKHNSKALWLLPIVFECHARKALESVRLAIRDGLQPIFCPFQPRRPRLARNARTRDALHLELQRLRLADAPEVHRVQSIRRCRHNLSTRSPVAQTHTIHTRTHTIRSTWFPSAADPQCQRQTGKQ